MEAGGRLRRKKQRQEQQNNNDKGESFSMYYGHPESPMRPSFLPLYVRFPYANYNIDYLSTKR